MAVPRAERGLGGAEPTLIKKVEEQVAPGGVPKAPTPLYLNHFLGLDDAPERTYGWIENTFTGNTDGTPAGLSNFSVFPNRLANQWQGNHPWLVNRRIGAFLNVCKASRSGELDFIELAEAIGTEELAELAKAAGGMADKVPGDLWSDDGGAARPEPGDLRSADGRGRTSASSARLSSPKSVEPETLAQH
jgi:hypothetical protein